MFLALREIRRAKVRFGLLIAAVGLLVFLILIQQALQNGLLTAFARTPPQRTLQLRTTETFAGDFILKLEFRASPRADSGIFVRGRQLQCRDYSTMGPYRTLTKYKPQDWNEVEIVVKGASALCTCNGEVLEAAMPVPATGGIGIESDAGTMEYRNIRLKLTP